MGIKVAVIGGGSTYTPELVEGFAGHRDRLPIDELVLMDLDPVRLNVVGGLAGRILKRSGHSARLRLTTRKEEALEGADFVVVQLRVGGQAARLSDETLPLEYGCIGQETVGAGGFAKALRTVPIVLEIAADTVRLAGTDAWIVDFTNPVGIVTQALLDEGHRAIGLCNVAIGFERRFAQFFGVPPGRVALEHVGLNHLSWERAVLVDGVDRLPELLSEFAEGMAAATGIPVELTRLFDAIPSYYLRYYHMQDAVLAEQTSGRKRSRAEEVMDIERQLMDLYSDPGLDHKPELLEQRGGAYYSEAAAQLIASLHSDTGDTQVVDVRNDGALRGLAADDVVEVPAKIGRQGARPIPLRPLPPEMLGLVQQVKAYERLAVAAAVSGDRSTALKALLANPLVGRYSIAARLLGGLLEANREHLPRFFSTPASRPAG